MLLTSEQIQKFRKKVENKEIKVGVFDVETSYVLARVWSTGPNQFIHHDQIIGETQLITAQFMYSLDKKSDFKVWTPIRKPNHYLGIPGSFDDSEVVRWIVGKVNECDIVIAQNGRAFDLKVVQERAKLFRLPPIDITFMIDTYKSSSSSFKSLSHSLDYRSRQYGLGGKISMVRQDWIDIIEKGVSPNKKMVPYGCKDNLDTDTVFWKDLPYYNLPKATVNKILKLIDEPGEDEVKSGIPKYRCLDCSKSRQRRFDIETSTKRPFCKNCLGYEVVKND